MRRVNVKTERLAVLPSDALIEVFQPSVGFKGARPQYVPANLFVSTAAALPGPGIQHGADALVHGSVVDEGSYKKTTLFIDLTDLESSTTDLDMIGQFGPDLVNDGVFASAANWHDIYDFWDVSGGVAALDGTQGLQPFLFNHDGATMVAGQEYEVTFDVVTWSVGSVAVSVGSTIGTSRGAVNTFTERLVATNSGTLGFVATSDFVGSIDNVTLKKLGDAYITQFTNALNGAIFMANVTCLEVPAGGVTDIDFYSAPEQDGIFDELVTDLTQRVLLTKGGVWTADINTKFALAVPTADEYLYITCGAAGVPGVYTGGQFLFEFWGA